MRQVAVDARDKNNRAERFKVVTTILDASIDGGQIGDLYQRRWNGGAARQTTSQDAACIRPPDRPIVSVGALLRLARWCQGRRRSIQAVPMRSDSERPVPPRSQAA